jgi:hypothetical protein
MRVPARAFQTGRPLETSASDRNSFFLFRSARLARASLVSKARIRRATIPRTEMIKTTHQHSGIDDKTSTMEIVIGESGRLRSAEDRMPVRSRAVKITEVLHRDDRAGRKIYVCSFPDLS